MKMNHIFADMKMTFEQAKESCQIENELDICLDRVSFFQYEDNDIIAKIGDKDLKTFLKAMAKKNATFIIEDISKDREIEGAFENVNGIYNVSYMDCYETYVFRIINGKDLILSN